MGGKSSNIRNDVKALRTGLGISQAKLAEAIGATRQTIIALEAERYNPSLELAFRVAHTLGKRIDDVFTFSGEW